MAWTKQTFIDFETVIDADFLNDFQDQIISDEDDLERKVDAESGKGLSTNDYTTPEQTKLANIATGAQVNVIETIKVNGTAKTVSDKTVNITKSDLAMTAGDVAYSSEAQYDSGTAGAALQDLEESVDDAGTAISGTKAMIADAEASTTASAAHAIGDYFTLNGTLYKATAAIAIGDTITVGTNCEEAVIGDDLSELNSHFNDVESALNNVGLAIVNGQFYIDPVTE